MLFRRHQDIVAFKQSANEAAVAFHARNLEVAEISEEAWQAMSALRNEASDSIEQWNLENNPEVKTGKTPFSIRSMTINVTQVCNLHCTYCAAGGDGTFGDPIKKISIEKTLPQLKFFLEKLKDDSSFHITFLGGEPLLYSEGISLIVDYVNLSTVGRNIRATYSVVTNGTLLDSPKILDLLAKIKADITISIDGPAEVNDTFRITKSKKGSTEQTVRGLKALLARKSEMGSIGLTGVFGKDNMAIEEAYSFYSDFNVDWFEFNYEYGEGSEEINQQFMAKLTKVAAKAYEKGQEKELRRIRFFDHYFDALDEQQQVENHCGAGKSFLMMDARNNLYTCPWVVGQNQEIINRDGSLENMDLKGYQEPLIEKHGCGSCWARFMCGGGCMLINKLKTGDKHKKDLQFCDRTKYLISLAIMYYQKSRAA